MLDFEEFKTEIKKLTIGKAVGKNVYVLWPDLQRESSLIASLIEPLGSTHETTLIKFFLDQYRISFLQYPHFFEEPHPSLFESLTIDLATGKRRRIDYSKQQNPPILHRKETMVSPSRQEYESWLSLTKKLEEIGCYDEPKKIGFKQFWEDLLQIKGYTYKGHQLIAVSGKNLTHQTEHPTIDRHKTAMARSDFSRPVQFLIKYDLLQKSDSFFDFGCGLGDDIRGLNYNGYQASGWDPVHSPETKKVKADVVNLGFVLNVIEKPHERIEVIHEAFNLAKKVLSIAVVTDTSPTAKDIRPYGDGFLTSRGTFQKFFKHEEIYELLEEVLNCSVHTIAPGIFLIFKKEKDAQDFLSSRQKRHVDWNQLNMHVFPSKDERDAAKKEILYQKYREDIERYWEKILELGRIPTDDEYLGGLEIKEKTSLNERRLLEWFIERYGQESLERAYRQRKDDLLVYLGLANFNRRIPFTSLSPRLQKDMKTFFGSYKAGQQEALVELFKIGNPKIIAKQCAEFFKSTGVGRLDEQALYIQSSEIVALDPILRMYVGTASLLYGDTDEIETVKIHMHSVKVSFIVHKADDLRPNEYLRIKVDLRDQKVYFFKHQREHNS